MLRLMSSDGKAEKERNSMIYKFDKKELTQKGQYFKIPGPGFLPRYQTPISPRENFITALNGCLLYTSRCV